MTYIRRTHNRSQRFGGHTKHVFYCSCGRTVRGNGGKQHFKIEGHKRILRAEWGAMRDRSAAGAPEIPEDDDVIVRCGDPCPEAPDLDPCLLPRGHAYPWHRNRPSSWPVEEESDA